MEQVDTEELPVINPDLKKFLDLITNPDSRLNPDNYIASRKINDNNLTLTVGYLNGSAWISGIAFDRLIKVRFNYFENSCGFYTSIDGEPTMLALTKVNIIYFLTTGKFILGTYLANGNEA
jgi:hypothetical protein